MVADDGMVVECAVRLFSDFQYGLSRHHFVPLMQELNWLHVSSRIRYKLCMSMYDVVHRTWRLATSLTCVVRVEICDCDQVLQGTMSFHLVDFP